MLIENSSIPQRIPKYYIEVDESTGVGFKHHHAIEEQQWQAQHNLCSLLLEL